MATSAIRFPYGVFDFQKIREKQLFFVDNTEVIKQLEAGSDHVLLCRPPRFGKSLLLSMLSMYYDEQQASLFEKLFGSLWIGKNPTDNQNKYRVLHLDLSISADENDPMERVKQLFSNEINDTLEEFRKRYKLSFKIDRTDFTSSMRAMCAELKETSSRLLILVDEYDNWANQILIDGDTLRSPESLKNKLSPLKILFKQFKKFQKYHLADFRTVTVGVSVLPLSDISGWNIYRDLTHEVKFATALGFTEAGVESALNALGVRNVGALLRLVRTFFNGYDFAGGGVTMFNPQQVIYFCECYREKKLEKFMPDISVCDEWPLQLCYDFVQVTTDRKAVSSEDVFAVAVASPYCTNDLLDLLASHSSVTIPCGDLNQEFRLQDVLTSRIGLLRFMLHHGLVTLATSDDVSSYVLRAPNELVRIKHWAALMRLVQKNKDLLTAFWREPSAATLKQLLDAIVKPTGAQMSSSRLNETALQFGFGIALRVMSSAFAKTMVVNTSVHIRDQEIDLLLQLPEESRLAIIELKRAVSEDIDLGPEYPRGNVGDMDVDASGEPEQMQMGDDETTANKKKRRPKVNDTKARNVVVRMQREDLLAIKVFPTAWEKFGGKKLSKEDAKDQTKWKTVVDLVDSAKAQTGLQMEALRSDPTFKNYSIIYRFAVVQVIEPLLVDQAL